MGRGRVVLSYRRLSRHKLQLLTQANPYHSLRLHHHRPRPHRRLRHLHVRLRLHLYLQRRRLWHRRLPERQLQHRSKRLHLSLASPPERTPLVSQCSSVAHYAAYCRTGTGNCDGAVNDASGKPIEVPCDCPPSQAVFNQHLVADVLAGHAVHNPTVKVNFPLDNSKASLLARFNAASDTLQNLNGPGKGCPIVSTTFQAQVAAINAGKPLPQPVVPPSSSSLSSSSSSSSPARSPSPAPVLAAAPPPAPSTSGQPTPAQIEALAPQLGFQSGKNPTGESIFFCCCNCGAYCRTGTGNCDGAVNDASGKPIEVPCDCPPSQAVFNQVS